MSSRGPGRLLVLMRNDAQVFVDPWSAAQGV